MSRGWRGRYKWTKRRHVKDGEKNLLEKKDSKVMTHNITAEQVMLNHLSKFVQKSRGETIPTQTRSVFGRRQEAFSYDDEGHKPRRCRELFKQEA